MSIEEGFSHEAMRRIRAERGMSQAELGRRAGLGEKTRRDLEKGKRKPRTTTVSWIAGALACQYDDLLYEDARSEKARLRHPKLTLKNLQDLEETARSSAVAGGVEAMLYYRSSHLHAGLQDTTGNPSTDADIRATVATIRALTPRLDAFTNSIGRRYCLLAEELDSQKSSSTVTAALDDALKTLSLGGFEITRSGRPNRRVAALSRHIR